MDRSFLCPLDAKMGDSMGDKEMKRDRESECGWLPLA